MLFARPLTVADRPAIPLWLDTVVVKLVDVDTSTLYVAAPATVLQLRVGEVDWLTALFEGKASVGAPGVEMTVVKLQMFDHELAPFPLVAFASQ